MPPSDAVRRPLVITIAVLASVAAGCGDDDASSAPGAEVGADGSVTIVADDLAFDPERVSAEVGTVEITLDNRDDGVAHNIVVTGNGVDEGTELERGPATQELTVEFPEAGSYSFVCEIHPPMKGTFEVG